MSGRRPLQRAVRHLMSLASVLALAALLMGIARAGSRTFYCAPMHALAFTACCASAHDADDAADEGAAHASDHGSTLHETEAACCEEGRLGALPSSATGNTPEPLAAPLVGWVAPPRFLWHLSARLDPPRARAHLERTGPPDDASERRASLMVFLI